MKYETVLSLREEFEQNGAVCLRDVFSEEWLDLIASGIEKNLQSPSHFAENLAGRNGAHYFNDYCNWNRIDEFKKYAFESPAARIAGLLTDSQTISFYHEHVLVKEPETDVQTPWHQDQSYYPIDGDKVCSVWMPIDTVSRDTCVQFVSGSHKWGWFQPRKFATTLPYQINGHNDEKVYQPVPHIDKTFDILSWDLKPGDCIVFHMKCLHGAPGNASQTRNRRVFSTRWLGDDAVIVSRPWVVSPPIYGGLEIGQRASSAQFPTVWTRDQ